MGKNQYEIRATVILDGEPDATIGRIDSMFNDLVCHYTELRMKAEVKPLEDPVLQSAYVAAIEGDIETAKQLQRSLRITGAL